MFITALFTIAKMGKPPKCPSLDEGIKEMCYIRTMEYYSVFKKKENLSYVTTWMNLEDIVLREISQSQDKGCAIPLT